VQTQFLKRFAPNSLYLLFHPADTGNPNYDLNTHLEKFASRFINDPKNNRKFSTGNATRIDLESTQLIGGRVLGRVEIDLGSPDETEQQHKILSIPYALKKLGTMEDAIEFVRVITQAVSAGVEPDPRSFQIWTSWAYNEIDNRYAQLLRNTSSADAQTLAEFKATVIQDVLTELASFARTLTAITATNEDRLFEEPKICDRLPREEKLSPAERRDLFEQRYDEVMCIEDPLSLFASELRSICSKLSQAHSSGIVYDEEAQFQSHLTSLADSGLYSDEQLEKLQDAHERVTEQYSEDGVVSLHMSDGERFVVEGTLEEDVTEEYLPIDARAIAADLLTLFRDGEDIETIERFIELSLNRIYGDPTDKAQRVSRTARALKIKQAPTRRRLDGTCHSSKPVRTRNSLFQFTYTVSVYRNREERQYVREVLDILFGNMQRDFILRSMNRSTAFRTFHNQIANASDLRSLIEVIKEAYQARLRKAINIKMFTALNTLYECKRANFESNAVRITKERDGQLHTFMPAVPVITMAKQIAVPDLRNLAIKLHALPAQEQERVRKVFREERPDVYQRIVNGLTTRISTASQSKKMYFRFAFYVDRKTGRPNEPRNMIHLLTAADTAAIWQQLKESTGVDQPRDNQPHSLPQNQHGNNRVAIPCAYPLSHSSTRDTNRKLGLTAGNVHSQFTSR
jgi:hypothetical protein